MKLLPSGLALLFLISISSAAPPPPLLANEGALPLASGQALQLFRQCSRSAPTPEGIVWQPSPREITQLEAALPSYLYVLRAQGQETPPAPPQYRGQFAAFTVKGEPRIYASYVPTSAVSDSSPKNGSAHVVCDGGRVFWGIVYNPADQSFSELQFNGP